MSFRKDFYYSATGDYTLYAHSDYQVMSEEIGIRKFHLCEVIHQHCIRKYSVTEDKTIYPWDSNYEPKQSSYDDVIAKQSETPFIENYINWFVEMNTIQKNETLRNEMEFYMEPNLNRATRNAGYPVFNFNSSDEMYIPYHSVEYAPTIYGVNILNNIYEQDYYMNYPVRYLQNLNIVQINIHQEMILAMYLLNFRGTVNILQYHENLGDNNSVLSIASESANSSCTDEMEVDDSDDDN